MLTDELLPVADHIASGFVNEGFDMAKDAALKVELLAGALRNHSYDMHKGIHPGSPH